MIRVGQNAHGEWAWMLFADRRMIASGEGLKHRRAALAVAAVADRVYREMAEAKAVCDHWPIDPSEDVKEYDPVDIAAEYENGPADDESAEPPVA